jgi:NADH:ubiquinone oxidoreductase subunit 4 (subunit M)
MVVIEVVADVQTINDPLTVAVTMGIVSLPFTSIFVTEIVLLVLRYRIVSWTTRINFWLLRE